MDKPDRMLEIIDRAMASTPTHSTRARLERPPVDVRRLLSHRVAGSRYVFPNLAPPPATRWTLALAGREECASDYQIDRATYPFYVVEYMASGRGVAQFGDEPAEPVEPGAVFAYAPAMRYRMRIDPAAPAVKFFFALAGRDAPKRLAAAKLAPGVIRRLAAPAEVLSLAEDIIREGRRHSAYAPAICLKLMELILLKVADAVEGTGESDDRARENFLRCRALIEARAEKLKALDDVAAELHIDPSSICRLFRRFQGTTPYQYLLRRKMALAAEYLIETGGLVKEAAQHVGFADPYHFARCFKAVHGIAPSEVRRYQPQLARARPE